MYIYLMALLVFMPFMALPQSQTDREIIELFTDREFCVSGDTVWFKAWLPYNGQSMENIIRVQLDGAGNNLISSVLKKVEDHWAEGYIPVPDSLSTGQYFITAFLNSSRDKQDLQLNSKAVLVFNRFEDNVNELKYLETSYENRYETNENHLTVLTEKEEYVARENVKVVLAKANGSDFSKILVKAALVDPISGETGKNYKFSLHSSNSTIPDIPEKDGFLISGRVVDQAGRPRMGIIVILSVYDEPPYFDYCISGDEGDYHFLLKNAVGSTNMVIQAIPRSNEEYRIERVDNQLIRQNEQIPGSKYLNQEQSEFINSLLTGNFISRLFGKRMMQESVGFSMPERFTVPFYGKPTKRVVPDEFYDLPNFLEISREIIPGVQFRERDGTTTFRLLNQSAGVYFESEPLRLINGIPVFKNNLFTSLESKDITYIDVVETERIFGDLSFQGVVSVSLKDKSNSWMARQPNVFQFYTKCLQPEKKPGYMAQKVTAPNIPDIRQVFFWDILDIKDSGEIEFNLSDLKGEVEITVMAILEENKVTEVSKTIKVK